MAGCTNRADSASLLSGTRPHQAEADVGRTAGDFALAAAADQISRTVLIGAQVRAAAKHALLRAWFFGIETVRRTLRIDGRGRRPRALRVRVRSVPVGAPLPDVAADVVQ